MIRRRINFFSTFVVVALVLIVLLFSVTEKKSLVSANDLLPEQSSALSRVNKYRIENGLSELKWNSRLSEAAMLKLLDEDANDYFDHVSPDGKTAWDFIENCGYNYSRAGENLSIDFKDEGDAFDAWTNSETHRNNIEFENYSDFGFASLNANIDGRERVLMVQMFGLRNTKADRALTY